MSGIRLVEVTKSFGRHTLAVDRINLEVRPGELMVLVGPSGCGKTTTLRLIAGLEEPTSGEIWLGDRLVNNLPPRQRDVAMVFQNYALYPHMTVRENLAFGLKMRRRQLGLSWDEIDRRVRDVAATLGILHLLDRKPRQLSGGERQRVALGRALVRQPAVFLLDEPLSNLDAQLRLEVRRELKKLHQSLSATMVYVTHDQVEAMTLGDRVAVLREGRLQQVADPQELYRFPANVFVARFIGSPPMNLVPGQLRRDGDRMCFEGPGFVFFVPYPPPRPGPVVWGIRPEHVRVLANDGTLASDSRNMYEEGTVVELAGQVTVSEPWGREQVVYCRVGSVEIAAICPGEPAWQPGTALRLLPQLAESHWFDANTGERLAERRVRPCDGAGELRSGLSASE